MVYRVNMKEWLHIPLAKGYQPGRPERGKCPDAMHDEITSRAGVNPARVDRDPESGARWPTNAPRGAGP